MLFVVSVLFQKAQYEVEKILNKRVKDGNEEYLLRWRGFPPSEDSWVLKENLDCPHLIEVELACSVNFSLFLIALVSFSVAGNSFNSDEVFRCSVVISIFLLLLFCNLFCQTFMFRSMKQKFLQMKSSTHRQGHLRTDSNLVIFVR